MTNVWGDAYSSMQYSTENSLPKPPGRLVAPGHISLTRPSRSGRPLWGWLLRGSHDLGFLLGITPTDVAPPRPPRTSGKSRDSLAVPDPQIPAAAHFRSRASGHAHRSRRPVGAASLESRLATAGRLALFCRGSGVASSLGPLVVSPLPLGAR